MYAINQPRWQRILLLSVLGYEAAGCMAGGIMLVAQPDGRLMDMPVSIMHGAFADFFVRGVILVLLGLLNAAAFFSTLLRRPGAWAVAGSALVALLGWFWVEIAILQQLHWLHAMWGLPVLAGIAAVFPLIPGKQLVQQLLLSSAIIATAIYISANIIVPANWPTYNAASQAISELSATNAPTRMLWLVLTAPYTLLMLAFSFGVNSYAGNSLRLRITAWLLFAYAALGILWPFAPMHSRDVLATGGHTMPDSMHLALAACTVLCCLGAMVFSAATFGRAFRIFSMMALLGMAIFAALSFAGAEAIGNGEPTPLLGILERMNIGIFHAWVIVLAGVLLKQREITAGQTLQRLVYTSPHNIL